VIGFRQHRPDGSPFMAGKFIAPSSAHDELAVHRDIKLSSSLKAAPEEDRQRAIMLAKDEAKYIAMTLLTSADHLRMLQGLEPMLPHPPQ
jgi:hypothetical protein